MLFGQYEAYLFPRWEYFFPKVGIIFPRLGIFCGIGRQHRQHKQATIPVK